jgi:hypothetical protein
MTNPIIKIHDVTNNKVTERPMNSAELEEYNLAKKISAAEQAEAAAKEAERAELLARLGITADEAKLLLGSN